LIDNQLGVIVSFKVLPPFIWKAGDFWTKRCTQLHYWNKVPL